MATKKPPQEPAQPETKQEPLVPAVPDAPKTGKRVCVHCGTVLDWAVAAYTIVRGDTLDRIAKQFSVPGGYRELARVNNIPNPDRIEAGWVIQVPPYNAQSVSFDEGSTITASPAASVSEQLATGAQDDGAGPAVLVGLGLLAIGAVAWWKLS